MKVSTTTYSAGSSEVNVRMSPPEARTVLGILLNVEGRLGEDTPGRRLLEELERELHIVKRILDIEDGAVQVVPKT